MCVAVSGKLTHGMLPGWCLYASDSNLGPALPAGRAPALLQRSIYRARAYPPEGPALANIIRSEVDVLYSSNFVGHLCVSQPRSVIACTGFSEIA